MFHLSEKSYFQAVWIISISILVAAGFIYRNISAKQNTIEAQLSSTMPSLKEFPVKLHNWQRQDVNRNRFEEQTLYSDDALLGIYRKSNTGQSANIYITFCAHPRNMLGHRPEVCFTSSGWNIEKSERILITTLSGAAVPCVKYIFQKSRVLGEEMCVLNFYILNGKLTDNHREFSGIKWRTLTNPEEKVRYVTQIQISSSSEETARIAAEEMCDSIIEFFPNRQGFVNQSLAFDTNK